MELFISAGAASKRFGSSHLLTTATRDGAGGA
jgi:hypothetical protein